MNASSNNGKPVKNYYSSGKLEERKQLKDLFDSNIVKGVVLIYDV